MFYFQDDNKNWHVANEVHTPSGRVLTSANKEMAALEGWIWHDTEPEEYKEWSNQQNQNI